LCAPAKFALGRSSYSRIMARRSQSEIASNFHRIISTFRFSSNPPLHAHIHLYISIYIYIYIYMCVCVCVCVYTCTHKCVRAFPRCDYPPHRNALRQGRKKSPPKGRLKSRLMKHSVLSKLYLKGVSEAALESSLELPPLGVRTWLDC